ncbi:MAG TPA: Ig-like domain-containing protein [Fibrobacteria bacterium]|nr:Ig-like domain-containing protein [Fibrobacteria bacterium]
MICIGLFHVSCNQEVGRDSVLDLGKVADSLRNYDSVRIVLRYPDSSVVDTIFHGKLLPETELSALPIRDISGAKVIIHIAGYLNGAVVYSSERYFDAGAGKTDSIVPIILPSSAVSIFASDTDLTLGDSARLPAVEVSPANLRDRSVNWYSNDPRTLSVSDTYYRALKVGSASLKVRLAIDPGKQTGFAVRIVPRSKNVAPDSVRLSPDTLELAAKGAPKAFVVAVYPAGADKRLAWTWRDSTLVEVDSVGQVRGLAPGLAWIAATLTAAPGVSDTAWAKIGAIAGIDSVRISMETLRLFAGGSQEQLTANVYPLLADQNVSWSVKETGIVALVGNSVKGLQAGTAHLVARSRMDTTRTDTLIVLVAKRIRVDSLLLDSDSLTLYQGGAAHAVKATLYPEDGNASLAWVSRDTAVVLVDSVGILKPVRSGRARVVAMSRADTSRQDSVMVLVKRDPPVLAIGRDTTLGVGGRLDIVPQVKQEYGSVVLFRWDMDGDASWDDSSKTLLPVSHTYPDTGTFSARFYVRDSEGNDTLFLKRIRLVKGPIVLIDSPMDSSFTNIPIIEVAWRVDGKAQTSRLKDTLVEGPNTIRRYASDSSGVVNYASVVVYLDTVAPIKPKVVAKSPVNTRSPTWTWSASGGGNGDFRFILDGGAAATAPTTHDTLFMPLTPLDSGVHVLYVQERDAAGNWSSSASAPIRIDLNPPPPPAVSVSADSKPNNPAPTWIWESGKGDGMGVFRFKLDDPDAISGTETGARSFKPAPLSDGLHILYVAERDSAGNWSLAGKAGITLDLAPPPPPKVGAQASLSDTMPIRGPVSLQRPTWTWSTGGGDGTGRYRIRLDTAVFSPASPTTKAKAFVPAANLAEGAHTLYVQESDSADNWSETAAWTVVVDLTPPTAPTVSGITPTNNRKPIWSWLSGGGGAGFYRYCMDCADIATTFSLTQSASYSPVGDLGEGLHKLTVQERDSAGNWSASGSFAIRVDLTPPLAPKIIEKPITPTYLPGPRWAWSTSGGGAGFFRFRFDNKDMSSADSGETTETQLNTAATAGYHSLYVQERDTAGNWSNLDSAKAFMVADSLVGGEPLSQGAVTGVEIAYNNGYLYAAFVENGKITVKRNRQSASGIPDKGWEQLGGTVGEGNVSKISMAVAGGVPYLAFLESASDGMRPLRVYKYSGGSAWVPADTIGFSMGDIYGDFRLTAYQDPSRPTGYSMLFLDMVYEETFDPQVRVLRYDGLNWLMLKKIPIFFRSIASTAIRYSAAQVAMIGLGSGMNGEYRKLSVAKVGDTTESFVSTHEFPKGISLSDMAIDSSGATFLSMISPTSIWKISGGTLQSLPAPPVLSGPKFPLSLYGNNVLYTIYPKAAGLEAAALWADGWHGLRGGSASLTAGGVYGMASTFTGVPMVAYADAGLNGRLVVRMFGY